MSLAARLAKLEAKHKHVLRCPWCRYALRADPAQGQRGYEIAPDSVLRAKCWYCGTKYGVPIRGLNEHQREATALFYNSHPSKRFNDERVHAASIWLSLNHSEVEEYQRVKQKDAQHKRGNQTRYPPSFSHSHGRLILAEEKARRERGEVKQRAIEFDRAQTERFKILAGTAQFPLDQTLDQIESEYSSSGYDNEISERILSLGFDKYYWRASRLRSRLAVCNSHLKNLKKREACEVVIWSEALPDTREELEFFDHEKQRQIEKALEAKRREEEDNRAEAERLEAQERERIRMNEEKQAEAKRQLLEMQEEKAFVAEFLKQHGL